MLKLNNEIENILNPEKPKMISFWEAFKTIYPDTIINSMYETREVRAFKDAVMIYLVSKQMLYIKTKNVHGKERRTGFSFNRPEIGIDRGTHLMFNDIESAKKYFKVAGVYIDA